jgi:hypothetical protein
LCRPIVSFSLPLLSVPRYLNFSPQVLWFSLVHGRPRSPSPPGASHGTTQSSTRSSESIGRLHEQWLPRGCSLVQHVGGTCVAPCWSPRRRRVTFLAHPKGTCPSPCRVLLSISVTGFFDHSCVPIRRPARGCKPATSRIYVSDGRRAPFSGISGRGKVSILFLSH